MPGLTHEPKWCLRAPLDQVPLCQNSFLPVFSWSRFSKAAAFKEFIKTAVTFGALISGWGGGKKKRRGFDPGISKWRSGAALSITRGFWKACAFGVVVLSSVEEEGTPKFPSCSPKLETSSWIYWIIFKTRLRGCSRPSSIKCDPSRMCTSETAESLQMVGQICPYFKPRITLDLNNTFSSGHALPATKKVLQRHSSRAQSSPKAGEDWERTGEFPLQVFIRFQSCCSTWPLT